MNIILSLSNRC